MNALIVVESLYGNTETIGQAIAEALRTRGMDARSVRVPDISPADTIELDLLVIGGPTHAHGMTSTSSRRTAAKDKRNDYPHPTVSPGLRSWVKELPLGGGRLVAAFDTRFDRPILLTGSAARAIGRRLEKKGYALVLPPESFFVSADNRLVQDQREHASRWAAGLAVRTRDAMLMREHRTAA